MVMITRMQAMLMLLTMTLPRWDSVLRPAAEWGRAERAWRAGEEGRAGTGGGDTTQPSYPSLSELKPLKCEEKI